MYLCVSDIDFAFFYDFSIGFWNSSDRVRGGSKGGAEGGAQTTGAPPPLKLEKNMIFWRKIVIFHTKYPKNVRASLRSAQFFKVRPPNL